jgi:hypothetical protein
MNPLPFGWQGDIFLLPYWISRQRPSSCWLSYRNSEVEGGFFFFGFLGLAVVFLVGWQTVWIVGCCWLVVGSQ